MIMEKDETIAVGLQEIQQLREQLREQMHYLEDERNGKDSVKLKLTTQPKQVASGKEVAETRSIGFQLPLSKNDQPQNLAMASNGAEGNVSIKLKWREGKKALCKIYDINSGEMAAAVDGNSVYVLTFCSIYAYNTSTLDWSQLPDSRFEYCALAIVNNLVTLIGGLCYTHPLYETNKLFSLTRKGGVADWTEEFPPMPTKRYGACALCTGTALIVAGGQEEFILGMSGKVATIEVLNTATLQWSTAVDLPQPTYFGSLVQMSNDQIYILGAYNNDTPPRLIRSVYGCSLSALLQSCTSHSFRARLVKSLSRSKKIGIWRKVTDLPAAIIDSAYVSLHGQLLAIGGKNSDDIHTSAVHMFNPSIHSWEVISHMATPRCSCYAAVLPDNQLIVVGGYTCSGKTDTVEIATLLK